MTEAPTIIEAIRTADLIGDNEISTAQITALKAAYGLPLDADELEIYERATEKSSYKPAERRECVFICGRRSGKDDKLAANVCIYEAIFRPHILNRGERGYVLLLAATKEQAKVCFNYILGKLESSRALASMIAGDPRADEIDLTNGITISVVPANFRTVRGRSVVCAVCSEIAFWHDSETNANPAKEILRALRPSMATFKNSKLILVSSPFAKQGPLYEAWQKRHALDLGHKRLVWKLDSLSMNPSLDVERLREEEEADPENFAREYGAQFWESASNFLRSDAIDVCVIPQRFKWQPQPEFRYFAALDAAFRGDAFAFSVVHTATSGDVVQDLTRSWRGSRANPVQLAEVLAEIVSTLRRFNTRTIFGDQFCSEPIRQALAAQGVEFILRQTLGARAQCMNSLRTLITSKKIALLDDAETVAELKNLELIVTGGGGVRVEARVQHDDRAVSLALAAHECISAPKPREPICCVLDLNSHDDVAQRTEEDLRSRSREEYFFRSRGSSFRW